MNIKHWTVNKAYHTILIITSNN